MQFIKYFLLTASLLTTLFFGIGWYIQPLSGDLTRLGGISERTWGWNQPQPIIDVVPNETYSVGPVIVIGDSFSEKNIWQSILSKETASPIFTYHWLDLEPATCLERAIDDIRARFPNTKIIILQSLERLVIDRFGQGFASSKICKQHISSSIKPDQIGLTGAMRNVTENLMPDPVYALKALLRESYTYDKLTLSGDTYIAPLVTSNLFSNARSDHLLFYKRDLEKSEWTQEKLSTAAKHLKLLSDRLAHEGVSLVIAPVPDKSTVYYEHLKQPVFSKPIPDPWATFKNEGLNTLNLKDAFVRHALQVKDLYLPDDTHLGMQGYKIFSEMIQQTLTRLGKD